jgi:hypothetical protein
MIHIKRFIDKISYMEGKQGKDVVLPIVDARGLRDELVKLLADNYDLKQEQPVTEPVFQVEVKGGTFK